MGHATARMLDSTPPDLLPESELISSDGVPLDSPWHRQQINLFIAVVRQAMAERGEDSYFAGGDMFVYYSPEQARAVKEEVEQQLWLFQLPEGGEPEIRRVARKHFRGPDVFVVRGGVEDRERKVWASWLEGGRLPDLVLELQSGSTADVDAVEKKELYSRVFRTPEYFTYGPDDPDLGRHRDLLAGRRLATDGSYEEIELTEKGWVWSEVLEHYVGRWDGVYEGRGARWIRLYDSRGRLVPTPEEFERQRADAAEAEIVRLKELLERP